jgi:acetyl esterase
MRRLEREGVPVTALHLSDQTHRMLTLSKVIGACPRTLAYVAAALVERWSAAAVSVPDQLPRKAC